ncbi:hypothetical protein [Pseudochelatococcus contaminans]|uniref:Uncharacterized protein n=1 Tax=Pseudochelatococcus contaminans TaxID=1538103 RepID=A0A7W6EGC0_9HYPH|nr:hypothetical protein [Pseudochelatococcus contaminans]MBB3809331.1 hypothetical protein [Pseudochelatococcus contaminans]
MLHQKFRPHGCVHKMEFPGYVTATRSGQTESGAFSDEVSIALAGNAQYQNLAAVGHFGEMSASCSKRDPSIC